MAKTIRSLLVATVAGAGALVEVGSRTGHRNWQCRLEIPLVAVRIERQRHHTPVVPGRRLDIRCVEFRGRQDLPVGFACAGLSPWCDDRIECLAAGAHDEFADALLWIVIPGGVKGAVAGVEVVVPVQHQVGVVLVEELPKGQSGGALMGEAVGGAVRGLVPVGECARGMILLEIIFQPCEFGGKPGAGALAAARLGRALYVERNKVPRAQIVGVPAISDSARSVGGSSKCPACPSARGMGWGVGVLSAG